MTTRPTSPVATRADAGSVIRGSGGTASAVHEESHVAAGVVDNRREGMSVQATGLLNRFRPLFLIIPTNSANSPGRMCLRLPFFRFNGTAPLYR